MQTGDKATFYLFFVFVGEMENTRFSSRFCLTLFLFFVFVGEMENTHFSCRFSLTFYLFFLFLWLKWKIHVFHFAFLF